MRACYFALSLALAASSASAARPSLVERESRALREDIRVGDALPEQTMPEDSEPATTSIDDTSPTREPAASLGSTRRFSDRRVSLELRSGAATSVGLLGLVAEVSPFDFLAVGGGVGLNGWGLIWGAHVRYRPLIFRPGRRVLLAITLEASFSQGLYGYLSFDGLIDDTCHGDDTMPSSPCYSPDITPQTTSWAQLELGLELRLRWGFGVRYSGGAAHTLGSNEWQCEVRRQPAPCAGRSTPKQLLFVQTFAAGYSF